MEEFAKKIIEINERKWGKRIAVSVQKFAKNNGLVLTGLCFEEREKTNVSPVIYIDDYYKKYISGRKGLEETAEEIYQIYAHSRKNSKMDLSFFRDYEMAKMRIVYKLVNYEMNKDLLESVPHQRFLDLVAVCMFVFEGSEINEEGYATSLIRNMHLDMWGITSEELFARAKENTPVLRPYSIRSMDDLLVEEGVISREEQCGFEEGNFMFVLTNNIKLYGASTILYDGLLQNVSEKMGCNFYVLPSSVHEVLLIPDTKNEHDVESFASLVAAVNKDVLAKEEILSERAYYYSRETGKLEM